MISKRQEFSDFTFSRVESEPENWMLRAGEFRDAAALLVKEKNGSLSLAYYYNAALSLELLLKAILVSQKKKYRTTHRLKDLSDEAGIVVGIDQEKTLELFSEILIFKLLNFIVK